MESATAVAPASISKTRIVADLLTRCVERYGDRTAIRFKREGQWAELSYRELKETVDRLSLGLIQLGIEPGDRVCILSDTCPQWTYASFAITQVGAIVVPIYPTNSPKECEWVIGNSEAKAIVCQNADQIAKVREVRNQLPQLEHVIVIDESGETGDATPLESVIARGEGGDRSVLEQRLAGIKPSDGYTYIYTSGTTGPPKGCVTTQGNYGSMIEIASKVSLVRPGDVVYLFLPLAHGFALLIQLISFEEGASIAYYGGDTKQIITEVAEIRPTYLPSVPRIFEKIYTVATSKVENEGGLKKHLFWWAIGVGKRVSRLRLSGGEPSGLLALQYRVADKLVLSKVRMLFGGRLREAITGAAPIAPEILEFFNACGVLVLEGYGMTETSTAATATLPTAYKIGTVGKPLPGVEVKIASDGEVLIKGPNIFQGYYKNDEATREILIDGWLQTGDLGSIDADGYLKITGRKKDIIITAGGKNLTPANIENDLKQSRWISQAVMYGDRRPFPVALITLDEEEIIPYAEGKGLPTDIPSLAENEQVRGLIQAELDKANANYAQVEQIKKFAILGHDLTQETGDLTPTLKVKRNVVNEKYAQVFESLYS